MIAKSTVSPSLRIGLRFLGVWPHTTYSRAYGLIYMSSILIVQYFQYLYVFTHFKLDEFLNLVDALPLTLDYTLTVFKLAALWTHRRVFHENLTTMDNDWRECANVDQHMHAMTLKANVSHFCSNTMLSFYAMAGLIYLTGGYIINFAHVEEKRNDSLRQLPIQMQFPFEIERSPIFELLAAFLSIHLLLNACTIAILNSLISALVLHASGQIDIICQELKTISQQTPICSSSVSTLGLLIERHNRVILFSENIDKILSFMALMQIIWNTLVICFLGFALVILFNDMQLVHDKTDVIPMVKTILGYVGVVVEVFIFCFAGEYLSFKSKSIADAAYESLWYNLPLSQIKIISFIIMRSQKQLAITAKGITNLSLEAFSNIMKASASYISVLHAIY